MDSTIRHLRPTTPGSDDESAGDEGSEIARLLDELRQVDPAEAVEVAAALADRLGAALDEEST